jgi:hypothetical protein
MSMESASLTAGGNVNPARFIKLDSANHEAIQCAAATDAPIGISMEAQRVAPVTGAADYVAVDGESLPHYSLGDVCRLQIGSGGCLVGSKLVSDSVGKGVIAASTGTALQIIGAIAYEAASEDEFALVRIVFAPNRAALV